MEVATIGIDLAKNVFAVCAADSSGRVGIRQQLRRPQVLGFIRGLPRCVVGIIGAPVSALRRLPSRSRRHRVVRRWQARREHRDACAAPEPNLEDLVARLDVHHLEFEKTQVNANRRSLPIRRQNSWPQSLWLSSSAMRRYQYHQRAC